MSFDLKVFFVKIREAGPLLAFHVTKVFFVKLLCHQIMESKSTTSIWLQVIKAESYWKDPLRSDFSINLTESLTYALSFYRSQNVLYWSKFLVLDQKFIYILWHSQTFCTRQKDDLQSPISKICFCASTKVLKRH